jgi:hypothetical protein
MHFLYLQRMGRLSVEWNTDKDGTNEFTCRMHRRFAGTDTGMHAPADIYMRQLPCHPAGVRPALAPREFGRVFLLHLPRFGLQLDCRELGHARQWCDKHLEHPGLESIHAYLCQLMPWHGEMGRKHDANAYCLHRLHVFSMVCLRFKWPADKDSDW